MSLKAVAEKYSRDQITKKEKKHKFGAKRVETDGYSFASKLELAVYGILKMREAAKEIKILRVQEQIRMSDAEIVYIPDFTCVDLRTDEEFYVEAKGFETPEWRIKLKLFIAYGDKPLEIWIGNHDRPYLSKTIMPRKKRSAFSGTE